MWKSVSQGRRVLITLMGSGPEKNKWCSLTSWHILYLQDFQLHLALQTQLQRPSAAPQQRKRKNGLASLSLSNVYG